MKTLSLLFIMSMLFFSNCNVLSDSDNNSVEIRVKNLSAHTLENVRVSTGGGDYTYTSVTPRSSSVYHKFDYSYPYFYTDFSIDSNTFVQQPIDYVGEDKIQSGKYSFEITIEYSGETPVSFSGQLKKD